MGQLQCPGYNVKVAAGTAWDFASLPGPKATATDAQQKANHKAVTAALAQWPLNPCPSGCATIPIVRFVKQGVVPMNVPAGWPLDLELAYTDWELDILCIALPAAAAQPPGPTLKPETAPADVAPVTEKSSTR